MRTLKPWAYCPFEILLHAEMHYRVGEDFDRRISMIGFDNAIEVAITTYLNLHPIQRGKRVYRREDVEKWLVSYHTKVDFFVAECTIRNITVVAKQDEIIWFHDVRNGQYHIAGATVPQTRELDGVRAAALEIFAILFDEPGVEQRLEEHIASKTAPAPPQRDLNQDRLIDDEFGMVEVCGKNFYSSELLHAHDPELYREVALELAATANAQPGQGAP